VTPETAAREAWRDTMRARADERAYKELVSDLRTRERTQDAADSFALYSQQASMGLNVVISLATAVAIGYFAGRHIFGVNSVHGVRDGALYYYYWGFNRGITTHSQSSPPLPDAAVDQCSSVRRRAAHN